MTLLGSRLRMFCLGVSRSSCARVSTDRRRGGGRGSRWRPAWWWTPDVEDLPRPGRSAELAVTGLVIALVASSPGFVYDVIFVRGAGGTSGHLWGLASAATALGGVAAVVGVGHGRRPGPCPTLAGVAGRLGG